MRIILLEVIENEIYYNSVFLCKPHIWGNAASKVIQSALTQSICKFLWSSMPLQGIPCYLWFLAWRYSPRKGSIWDNYFCLSVSRLAQSHPNLPGLAISAFSWFGGMVILKTVQNGRQLIHQEMNFKKNYKI